MTAARAPHGDLLTDPATAPGLLYSHELCQRVEREAADACAMPWWFGYAAALVVVVAIAASAVWPWGVAT